MFGLATWEKYGEKLGVPAAEEVGASDGCGEIESGFVNGVVLASSHPGLLGWTGADWAYLPTTGELRLNPQGTSGWFNARFTDTAPGTWKVMAIKFKYGEGALQQIVSPKRENERSSLVITPSKCEPRPKRSE